MKIKFIATISLLVSLGALLLVTLPVAGQQPSSPQPSVQGSLTGKYEGAVKESTGEAKVTLDLQDESGKFSGTLTTAQGVFKLIKGQMVEGVLSLEFETKGPLHKLSLRPKAENLVGAVLDGAKRMDLELRRVVPDEISGEWDAAADANGQAVPFTLTLKVEGEKVTGASTSQMGDSTISNGSWKDGKLGMVLDSGSSQTALVATLVDGKLVGDFDFNGQLQGKWVAVKRKP